VKSLVDPFDQTLPQPKILDGSVTRSSGIRFRNTGNITLPATGDPQYLILYPGLSMSFCWKIPGNDAGNTGVHPSHLGVTADRNNIRMMRLVSVGLRLSLENSSDENEGYWEAVRIPINYADWKANDGAAPTGEDYATVPIASFSLLDMANHSTFQTGKLRDLHRFQFKLNSVAPDHPFKRVLPSTTSPTVQDMMDDHFDIIIIKVIGRIDAVTPSVLRYHTVANQEVVYNEATALARVQSMSVMIPQMDVILDRTRYITPAVQIS